MSLLRSILLGSVMLAAPVAITAMDLGGMLGVESSPCASNFADDNADGVIDAADVATVVARPVVGVVEVSFESLYRFGPVMSVSAAFDHDLPTTFTRTVIVPPQTCFLPPEAPVQRQIPATALDVGTSPVLTLAGVDYPLLVHPETAGSWQLLQTYVPDFEEAPATLRFPGGADVEAFEIPIERPAYPYPLNPDLRVGPHAVNYRRLDQPLILEFDAAGDEGDWRQIELQRTSTDELAGLQFDGQMPGSGLQEVPRSVLDAVAESPNMVRLTISSVRERRVPVQLSDGTEATVVVRFVRRGSYPYYIHPIIPPIVQTVSLNQGAESTTRTDVALRFEGNSHFTHYQVALDPDFNDAEWIQPLPVDIRPTYIETVINIPATPGDYTVYLRIRNERGTSETASATIRYEEPVNP